MQKLLEALTKAQLDIQAPKKNGENKFLKNRYATLDDVYLSCRKPLLENGLTLTHSVVDESGKYFLITSLIHVSGERMENKVPLFLNTEAKNASQAFAGGMTYARRHAVCALLALPSEDDDDAEIPSHHSTPQVPQVTTDERFRKEIMEKIGKLLNGSMEMMERILKGYDVKSFDEIKTSELPKILNKLQMRS